MRGAQHVILARGNVTPENACQTSVPVAPPTFSQALLFLFATPQRTRSRHTHGSIHKIVLQPRARTSKAAGRSSSQRALRRTLVNQIDRARCALRSPARGYLAQALHIWPAARTLVANESLLHL